MATLFGLDYPTIWFLVVGAVFSVYAILDGLDLGAGAIHLFLNSDEDRKIALNAIGPIWGGNEVWLVIGGGTLFAGFPVLYATLLSSMYIPFILFLFFIILRAIAIEFRGKENYKFWKQTWDIIYSVSSMMIAFSLGLVLGNVLQGMNLDQYHEFQGNWLSFVNIYSILTGLTTLALMTLHGGLYLCIKTEGKLFIRIEKLLKFAVINFVILYFGLTLYSILNYPQLIEKFTDTPILFIVPILGFLSVANIPRLISKQKFLSAIIFSSLTFSLLLITVAIELYPNLIFASNDIKNSITIYNAASSDPSLEIMMIIAAISVPFIVGYTFFAYRSFWGKVKLDEHSY